MRWCCCILGWQCSSIFPGLANPSITTYLSYVMELKSYQRAFLRSRAQTLDPVVYVGKDGFTDGVAAALDAALTSHELVKVRFTGSKDDVREISSHLEKATSSTLVAITGFTAVFFRQDADAEDRIYRI